MTVLSLTFILKNFNTFFIKEFICTFHYSIQSLIHFTVNATCNSIREYEPFISVSIQTSYFSTNARLLLEIQYMRIYYYKINVHFITEIELTVIMHTFDNRINARLTVYSIEKQPRSNLEIVKSLY